MFSKNRARVVSATLVLLLDACYAAAQDKETLLQSDQTQAQYQRKSITYIGLRTVPEASLEKKERSAIARHIKGAVEMKRFDYNSVNLKDFGTLEAFIAALREYVKKRAFDRAAAEAEYEARFKSARVYAADVDRIMSSAFLYSIDVLHLHSEPWVCWSEEIEVPADKPDQPPQKKIERKCRPGDPQNWMEQPEMRVGLSGRVVFLRANLQDETKPPSSPYSQIGWGGDDVQKYQPMPGPPPPAPVIPPGASKEERKEARERHRREMEDYRRRVAEYRASLPALQLGARLAAIDAVAGSAAPGVRKRVKSLPEFQLKCPVVGMHDDMVQFMLGKPEGVGLDDTYDVAEFDAAMKKTVLGYVKVRQVGDTAPSGQGTPSEAEKVREKKRFAGGEMLFEHPLMGASISPYFLFRWDVLGVRGDPGPMFGGGCDFDFDLANALGSPEIYLSFAFDYLYAGEQWHLVHTTLGFHKKWYATGLVFRLGGRVGLGVLAFSGEEGSAPDAETKVSGGGLVELGLELYFIPEFSLFLEAEGGYFGFFSGRDLLDDEIAAQAQLGLALSF